MVHIILGTVGGPDSKGVGSIMVWMPTERLSEEDSEFVCVCVRLCDDVIT